MRNIYVTLTCLIVLTSIPLSQTANAQSPPTGFELLGRGVNFGNMLEAPNEGEWGVRVESNFATLVAQAAFDHVRLPVRWSSHCTTLAPHTIDPVFLRRVQEVVDDCLSHNLKVVVNCHHFDELYADISQFKQDELVSIWRQLADSFADAPPELYFELLNEPHDKLEVQTWNALIPKLLQVVRPKHAERWIVIGPANYNSIEKLETLTLPSNDRHIIGTFHYYSPFEFTHQGAPWNQPQLPTGVAWTATDSQMEQLNRDISTASDWAAKHSRPLYLGEFGAYSEAEMASRATWTRAVRSTAEARGIGWAYWELASGFGVYDPAAKRWREPLKNALLK